MYEDRISLDEYAAVREGAAIGTVSPRAQLGVAGKDRASYLQGLLTNDIVALEAGSGCYAAWLTPQGRMLTDLHVLESGDMMLLDVPAALAEPTLQRLDQFLFGEDVQLAAMTDRLRAVWVHGPAAPGVVARVVGDESLPSWREYENRRLEHDGAPVVVARISQLGVPGYCLFAAPDQVQPIESALHREGARAVSPETIETVRVEEGYPVFGVDMTDDTIPLEAGIEERAISFTKGCYVGQEIIIRVLHRGGGRVARKLVGLRLDGDPPPQRGERILAMDRDIGWITSAASSPSLGSIALGYVHRDFTAAGTAVIVGEGRRPASVTPRPMLSVAR